MAAAIVLAGGAGRRLGGVDKAALDVAGVTMLDRVLGAARPLCAELVVVGPERTTGVKGVRFVQEDEPGGGPVPAVVAGLAATVGDPVLVVAVDLPLLSSAAIQRLFDAVTGHAAAGADHDGAPNPLLAVYRRAALSFEGLGGGSRADQLLPEDTVVVDLGAAAHNVNTAEDLRVARALAEQA
jgi:molybdopterin-guanine dinucleotide biosynthesis protein A